MAGFDAVVVGSGPNGLSAAAELTRSGRRVLVVEGAEELGGGTRTQELTLPGFRHDICSAIHPLGVASPFFRELGLNRWIEPDLPVSHPLEGGDVAIIHRNLTSTVDHLGPDGARYRAIIGPLVTNADALMESVLGPLTVPKHPVTLGRFGTTGSLSAGVLASGLQTVRARALLAGLASHAIAPLSTPFTGAVAKLFATSAHAFGWPLVSGGSQRLADDLAEIVVSGGGSIELGHRIKSLDDLPDAPIVMLDVMPPAALRIADGFISRRAARRLTRWQNGPAVFKVDWALDGPVPWADEESGRAGTVHVGGTFEEVAEAEAAVAAGTHPQRPLVIVAQQSLFDESRAPGGSHTLWGYCHVPAGSTVDMTDRIERQIERFAPGFSDRILARHTMDSVAFSQHNPNYVLGDIAGGQFSIGDLLRFGARRNYQLGPGLYLCSAATPPGAGAHGMCGFHAARAAISEKVS
ncbi:MAG: phytoene desaturase family protein [Acidimicrobiales bacterium]